MCEKTLSFFVFLNHLRKDAFCVICVLLCVFINFITMPKRCTFGCPPSSGMIRHNFPNPDKFPERFRAWVTVAGGSLETNLDYENYRKKVVCDSHFSDGDRTRSHRLNCLAVPSLNIPGVAAVNVVENDQGTACQSQLIQDSIGVAAVNVVENDQGTACQSQLIQDSIDNTELENNGSSLNAQDSTETEISRQPRTAACMLSEHNYCKIEKNKSKRSAVKKIPALLVPTVKPLQKQVIHLRRQINRLRKKQDSFKSRLAKAEQLSQEIAFKKVTQTMTNPAKIFTAMQTRLTRTSAKGRRFTLEEKILSLNLYKRSPKGFTLLSKYFTLPSPKSLKNLLAEIKLKPGINKLVFTKIKKTIKDIDIKDRLCTLIFDEMSLTPQIHFDAAKDELKGLTSHGTEPFANHALVFMVKGIKVNFKQPVAYYLTNSLKRHDLKNIIKDVISNVVAAGLKVICTVCDQGPSNVAAISALVAETREKIIKSGKSWNGDYFQINNTKIIPLYDVPHLIKGLRNNLLSKKMQYIDYNDNNKTKIIRWEYFQILYEADKNLGELRCLGKLTDEHIYKDKIKKMKVKNAAQVFSHTVACTASHLVARKLIPEECQQLVPFVTMIDNVFDSLNSNTFHIPEGKIYKGPVRRATPHHALWQKAIKLLKSMKFIISKKTNDKVRLIESTPPSVVNFIKTLEGMQLIWKTLSQTYLFDCMLTRNFNQDPVENFFGNIRSYGARNVAPNSIAFEGAYKSLLLSNFNSAHSIGANCEKDNNDCLQTLDFFLQKASDITDENDVNVINNDDECNIYHVDELVYDCDNVVEDHGQKNYVCGWVLTKCLKKIKSCKTCRQTLVGDKSDINNDYICRKEYNNQKTWLCYPSSALVSSFNDIQKIVTTHLQKKNVQKQRLKQHLKMYIDVFMNFPQLCDVHAQPIKELFVNTTMNILIYSWCRSINRILSGKIEYKDCNDYFKNEAQKYYIKHKHFKSK